MKSKISFVFFLLFVIFYLSINQFHSSIQISHSNKTRICCLILTTSNYFQTRARAVNQTWAPRCDKYFFISEQQTSQLPILPIKNLTNGYQHLTKKSTLAFFYVYEHFFQYFDWFVKADDDTYIFVENLRSFLDKQNPSRPISFGYNYKSIVKNGFQSGGAAYVLSREALRQFYFGHHRVNSTCIIESKRGEDVEIGDCLRKNHVQMGKSIDEYKRERFHPLTFSHHYYGRFPKWLLKYAENKPLSGRNCCSETTISFHYVKPKQLYFIDRIRYGFRS